MVLAPLLEVNVTLLVHDASFVCAMLVVFVMLSS
jgi:hypothetical protein